MIRAARANDLPRVRQIELAAGEAFRELGMHTVADDEPPTVSELGSYQRDGRAWIWADADDYPIAYLLVDVLDEWLNIAQVSVEPSHARQGLGRQLIDFAEGLAKARNLSGLTLTTYADVPWNGPYYERLGFRVVAEDDAPPGMRSIRASETRRGLDAWPRAIMARSWTPGHPTAKSDV